MSLMGLTTEELMLRYFQNKEIAKERNEENKLIQDELEHQLKESGGEQVVLQLPNGEWGMITQKDVVVERLDKDGLAQELLIAKDELRKPFDYSILTAQGKLKPDQITKHTDTELVPQIKVSKRKTKPRTKKVVL